MQLFSESVGPINLPDTTYEVKENEIAVATGWGQTDPDDSTLPAILQVSTSKIELESLKEIVFDSL